jgi:DNA-binding SARP family transcriptional activator
VTDFHLLGPLETTERGEPVELPAGMPRALLARLLLDANRVVSVEAIVDALWGQRPPPSAYKLVQVYISQLRKSLGRESIETRSPGYRLPATIEQHDLAQFEKLTEQARSEPDAARRAALLEQALSLWRGPALAEFRAPFAAAAGRRLAELRLAALEDRIDVDLELGRHDRLIADLDALASEEPLRERPRRQLMIALYRSGRHAEALARYREGRSLMVEELGIEPSPALQELERAILRRDPALDRMTPAVERGAIICTHASLFSLLGPLCGQERELVLVEIAAGVEELELRVGLLDQIRAEATDSAIRVRTAAFTSANPADDLARLAAEQEADLLIVADPLAVPAEALCDVALAPRTDLTFAASDPVLVPFGGRPDEWAALELGAWIARAHKLPLRLLGVASRDEQRDASRLLASASLALQRFAATSAEPLIVQPGPEGVLEARGSIIVASLPAQELDATRHTLIERTAVPLLLVRPGLRPSGLAPDRTLTQFSWSLRRESA